MKNVLLVFLYLILPQLLISNTAAQLFKEGNSAYEKQDFKAAINAYEKIVESGNISADVHYNLGNAYFQLNDIPSSILHFEKALKINPENEDAKHNLLLANAKTIDKIEAIPDLFLYRWYRSVFNLQNADNWAKWVLIFLFLGAILLCLFFFLTKTAQKKLAFYAALSFTILSLISWFLAHEQNQYISSESDGIIMEATVNINSSPSEGSSKLFVLHEGTKVKIKEESNDWLHISLPNGNEGWLPKAYIAGI